MLSKIYKKNIEYRYRKIGKMNVVFNYINCFEVNEVGIAIWNRINGIDSLDDIINDISAEYDVSLDKISSDIISFVDEMVTENVFY